MGLSHFREGNILSPQYGSIALETCSLLWLSTFRSWQWHGQWKGVLQLFLAWLNPIPLQVLKRQLLLSAIRNNFAKCTAALRLVPGASRNTVGDIMHQLSNDKVKGSIIWSHCMSKSYFQWLSVLKYLHTYLPIMCWSRDPFHKGEPDQLLKGGRSKARTVPGVCRLIVQKDSWRTDGFKYAWAKFTETQVATFQKAWKHHQLGVLNGQQRLLRRTTWTHLRMGMRQISDISMKRSCRWRKTWCRKKWLIFLHFCLQLIFSSILVISFRMSPASHHFNLVKSEIDQILQVISPLLTNDTFDCVLIF